jgi:hypothetical protein
VAKSPRVSREALQEIASGAREATHAEGKAMAHELALMREEEERDGTVLVKLQHASDKQVSGWFAEQDRRIPKSECRVGGRVTLSGRTYSVIAVSDPDDDVEQHVVRVR